MSEAWFVWDSDEGFLTFSTEQEARECADEILENWHQFARNEGEWSDETEGLCWGKIYAEASPVFKTDDNGFPFTDYRLERIQDASSKQISD